MRPEQLTLKGFGAFRESTFIDFSGVELFALTGPTGAGKTTILDGICFALYGSVPRHGKGAVAPVVTQGTLEANVAFVFSVDGEQYEVARRVRKDNKGRGANTDEASLENKEMVLAIGAGPVTQKVTELLGLDFDQFTTCVLLPQGEFARFLHDKPAGRQELLTALLDLEVYDRVGQMALERQRKAEGHLAMVEQRLTELGTFSESDLEATRRRESDLVHLREWLEETLPELTALEKESADLEVESEQQRARLKVLRSLHAPPDLTALGEAGEMMGAKIEAGRAELEQLQGHWEQLNEDGSKFPASAQLQHWMVARQAEAAATIELHPALAQVEKDKESLAVASAAQSEARQRLAEAADADRATHLRRGLKLGDPCPVCGQPLVELPPAADSGDLELAEGQLRSAEATEARVRKSLAESSSRADKLGARLGELGRQLEGVAELQELEAISRAVAAHQDATAQARDRLAAARSGYEESYMELKLLGEKVARLRSNLQAAWSQLAQAGLDPAPLDFENAVTAWRQLGAWQQTAEPRLLDAVEKATTLLTEVGQRRLLVTSSIRQRLEEVDLAPTANPRDVVVDALALIRTRREGMEEALEEALSKTIERDEVARLQKRARQLNQELRADRFKKWLFDELFASLVAGANDRLSDLTRGQYELVMEGRDFEVIDNLSAGNRRSVKTLSGGETFLVSLALALSLADQVAATASANSEGAGKLDSFFLDEGFGTLDAESMDVVANVISELGAAGKTVGIVTHVSELAEQMPVRFQVEKGPDTATVSVSRT
ncbi:MAG TPA: SMC family ATPase [Acidimicrobiia bacterium]|nr:SMC family ATPase [Acidimicrobiia bacterium]